MFFVLFFVLAFLYILVECLDADMGFITGGRSAGLGLIAALLSVSSFLCLVTGIIRCVM